MKTFFLTLLASVCLLGTFQAQNTSNAGPETMDIPAPVVNQFKKDYPTFTPTWSREGDDYRADYVNPSNGNFGMVVYSKNARVLHSETELEANSYPGSINDYHQSNLPAKRYKVYSTKDTSGTTSFYSTSDGQTYYFDKDGHFRGRKNQIAPGTTTTITTQ